MQLKVAPEEKTCNGPANRDASAVTESAAPNVGASGEVLDSAVCVGVAFPALLWSSRGACSPVPLGLAREARSVGTAGNDGSSELAVAEKPGRGCASSSLRVFSICSTTWLPAHGKTTFLSGFLLFGVVAPRGRYPGIFDIFKRKETALARLQRASPPLQQHPAATYLQCIHERSSLCCNVVVDGPPVALVDSGEAS
eukprot:scaffold278_cov362-Pinguiococcus_pyrenoidosus.AAC.1